MLLYMLANRSCKMPARTCTILSGMSKVEFLCVVSFSHVGNVMGKCHPPILVLGRDREKTVDPPVDVGAAAVKNVLSVSEVERPHNRSWTILDF